MKKINFTAIKVNFLKKDVDIEKALVSDKISSGYLYNDHEVKPSHIMLPKKNAYVKGYDGQTQ